MQIGSVTFVLAETIFRKLRAEFSHHRIARHLCDHARGRDAQAEAVAIDDCRLRDRKRINGKTVDEHVLRRGKQRCDGDAHRLMAGAQNIDPIDLDVINHADRPDNVDVSDQLLVNFFTQFRRELFRIV